MAQHIQADKARQLAYKYASASFDDCLLNLAVHGTVKSHLSLLSELHWLLIEAKTKAEAKEITSLRRFCRDCLARIPSGYAAPWMNE